MKKALSLWVVGSVLVGCHSAPSADAPPPRPLWNSEYEVVKPADGSKQVQLTQRDYLFRDVIYPDESNPQPVSLLVKQEVVSTYHLASDTAPDTALHAEAWPGETSLTGTPLWTVQADAGQGEIGDHFYKTTKEAFLDSFPIYTFYSLLTGKKIYISNTPLLSISTATAPYLTRYLTYRAQFAEHELPVSVQAPKFTGLVSYGDTTAALHTLALYGWPEDDKPEVATLYLLDSGGQRVNTPDFYLRDSDEKGAKAFSDFSLILVLSDESEVEIPFRNDAPVLDHARLPAGYTLKEIPAF